MSAADTQQLQDADERRLAEMGYKQELNRGWSGFQNFAISFTIISVLAGCFTTYYQAWNNGGPIAISWGWPIISAFILVIAFCMAELASAYPTAGGIYWWASKLGGPGWGWFTGWFNLLGLVAIFASVDYFAGQFLRVVLGLYNVDIFGINFADANPTTALQQTFLLFAILLVLHVIINIAGSHLVAMLNGISVWWHVLGVVVIVGILIFAPSKHATFHNVFTQTQNNSGFSSSMFWWYVLPLGFLLTQYTITGFDASAHISEETKGAAMSAPRGIWQSVFYSAIAGYIVLLAITFAAWNTKAVNDGGGTVFAVFESAMTSAWTKMILIICFIGQFFCGMSCLTSASRMTYAFSRDGAVPGWRLWSKVNQRKIPFNAVIFAAVIALILTLPALKGNKDGVTVAFTAVVSIGVIGLYVCWGIPIYLRWRMGDKFEAGPWNLGNRYKWMAPISLLEILIVVVIYFNVPFSSQGVPWESDFNWSLFNYTPVVTGGLALAIGIWWWVSAHKWFTGPRHTIEEIDTEIGAPPPHPEAP
ncbi:MAG TPA: amino acid permease [Solirubrobacteraceae bacterium]|nr:amino acid permease [Solirubrobacteraceae bacterium]